MLLLSGIIALSVIIGGPLRGEGLVGRPHGAIQVLGREQRLPPIDIVSKPLHTVLAPRPDLELPTGGVGLSEVRVNRIVFQMLEDVT
jgi:hypothetical protein